MPELFIELFSEEIPARMQKRAEEDLDKLIHEKLGARGLKWTVSTTFSSPRRLGVCIADLPAKAADINEEKKGPRVGAPDQAIQGFLRSAGLASIDQAQVVEDKKGAFYVARIERAGAATSAIVQEVLPEIIRQFPWPKSMRSQSSDLQWVRPLHNICCVFDGREVKIDVVGVGSEAATWGHRFHAPAKIAVKSFEQWDRDLRAAKVIPFGGNRKDYIVEASKKACAERGLEWVEDPGLLEEVAGLCEWPQIIFGDMDPAFLDLPAEVIRLSMRTHQKYFAVRDPKTKKLAPHFIAFANVQAKDGGKAIAAGNRRVLSARLNDARFFWETDKKTPLFTEERKEKLKKIVFHQKLGSVWDKVERVKALAVELCAVTGADKEQVIRAADLCKMDLVTETVGEFPELQGRIGRELASLIRPTGEVTSKGASAVSEHDSVAVAVEDHYRPLGPNDRVPTDKVAVTLALADKLDTLAAFWSIDERPTGSSDAYGLRRAALGVVRVLLAGNERASLNKTLLGALRPFTTDDGEVMRLRNFLREFLFERLKVQLRDSGKRHDLLDAVLKGQDDDLVRIVARVEALDAVLKTEDGANLLAGYKRAANILAAEEKKGKWSAGEARGQVDAAKLAEPAEKALHEALGKALPAARAAVEREDFAAAMKALSSLRAPVDAFFEKVLVNDSQEQLRRNRLLLLTRLVEATSAVADFSKIEG
ncbi:MAG: glycine--tRNA ligase subunit beta [Proteobacteria bacterium]|nr:glycine--tRNA ligase subunit beta [Pseudomonadota bacterium]